MTLVACTAGDARKAADLAAQTALRRSGNGNPVAQLSELEEDAQRRLEGLGLARLQLQHIRASPLQ